MSSKTVIKLSDLLMAWDKIHKFNTIGVDFGFADFERVMGEIYYVENDCLQSPELVKDDMQAALDLVEPAGVRRPGEGNNDMYRRIIEAYIEKFPDFAWDTLNHLVGSPEFIVALYHKLGPIQDADFGSRNPVENPVTLQ